jgi:copper chaperone NosL
MRARTRVMIAAAALAFGLVYALPVWKIQLEAPQYPEGLGLYIGLSTIDGMKPHDLQNINGLNHYVGMARIEPESFPELRAMPWILGGLIVMGLVTAATGSRRWLTAWTMTFLIAAVTGIADIYVWGYKYGHNLNPHAAIKVPGLSYQPPLIGSKKLLNFTAHSGPAAGGWVAIGAVAVIVLLTLLEWRRARAASAPRLPAGSAAV